MEGLIFGILRFLIAWTEPDSRERNKPVTFGRSV